MSARARIPFLSKRPQSSLPPWYLTLILQQEVGKRKVPEWSAAEISLCSALLFFLVYLLVD